MTQAEAARILRRILSRLTKESAAQPDVELVRILVAETGKNGAFDALEQQVKLLWQEHRALKNQVEMAKLALPSKQLR